MKALLILSCLLAVAASASAECAWVLWEENTVIGANGVPVDTREWKILKSFTSPIDCEQLEKHGNESPMRKGVFNKELRIVFQVRYLCLPDTVDPRGPKGK